MDPRVKTSAEDLRAQFELLLKLRDREEEMNRAILGIRDLRAQLQSLEKRLGPAEQTKAVVTSAADLRKKITTIEEDLIQVNATAQEDEANYPVKLNSKLGYLTGVADSADAGPTESELAVFSELDKQLGVQLASWREVLSKDLVALNESMQKSNVPSVAPAASRTN
jgi:DNA repair exonuclease SbcCD ATPase subunit